jgi:hypothetical protein
MPLIGNWFTVNERLEPALAPLPVVVSLCDADALFLDFFDCSCSVAMDVLPLVALGVT